jgi:putative flippase GtrA
VANNSKKSRDDIIQFLKFAIVGLSNTFIALAVYYVLLWIGCNYLIANAAAWIISVFNAFYWNNKYVFKNENTWFKALLKTYLSYGFSFLLGTFLLYVFVELCFLNTKIAPLLTLILTIPLNFIMNKFWTFK